MSGSDGGASSEGDEAAASEGDGAAASEGDEAANAATSEGDGAGASDGDGAATSEDDGAAASSEDDGAAASSEADEAAALEGDEAANAATSGGDAASDGDAAAATTDGREGSPGGSSARSEVLRRVVHASGTGIPLLFLGGVLTWSQLRVLLVAGTGLAVVLEVLRLVVGVDWVVYETLTRGYEQDNPAGYALFVVGMAAVGLAFGPEIAVPAMLMLTLGDPVSGLLGSGELRGLKRAEAVLGMFGVCVGVAVLTGPGLVAAVLGGAVATLADAAKPVVAGYVVDDNVTIPVGGALAMYAVVEAMAFLGGGSDVSLLVSWVAG